MKYVVTVEGQTFEIEVGQGGRVWVNNRAYTVDFQSVDGLPHYSLLLNHRSYDAHVERADGEGCCVVLEGRPYQARVHRRQRPLPHLSQRRVEPAPATGQVCAPLPGLLVAMPVQLGQQVEAGEVVAVLESMKMQLELQSPCAGVVTAVGSEPGRQVSEGELLVALRLLPPLLKGGVA